MRFDFNVFFIIFEMEEKIVLKNFDMLAVYNKQVSVSLPIINPCMSVLTQQQTKCEGFLFWFVIPFNLKTGRKSLNTSNLVKTVVHNRLKIACSVSALTTSDLKFPLMD